MKKESGVCLTTPFPEASHMAWENPARQEQEHPTPRPIEILLVDDNPVDVRIVSEGLREIPHAVRLSVAKDGVDALSFLRRAGKYASGPRPDLILLDIRLPRKGGFDVLEEIKQDPLLASIPVVVRSSSDAASDIQKAYALHANCYITKPDTFDEFCRTMRILVDFWVTVAKLPGREDWKNK